jgi:hypothetical protein
LLELFVFIYYLSHPFGKVFHEAAGNGSSFLRRRLSRAAKDSGSHLRSVSEDEAANEQDFKLKVLTVT